MTEFFVKRLEGAKSCDWMASHPSLKTSIITSSLAMPEIVEVVANIVGVWPLIVSYLKETGRKDNGHSLVVRSSTFDCITIVSYSCILFLSCLEEGDGWVLQSGPARSTKVPSFPHVSEIWKWLKMFWCLLFSLTCAFRINSTKIFGNALILLHVSSTFLFGWVSRIVLNCRWDWRFFHVCDKCSVSVDNKFVHFQSTADYGYYAFGEVAQFVHCLLRKIKKSSLLLLVEQREEYIAANHSIIAAIEEEHFLAGTRVLVALAKVGSF